MRERGIGEREAGEAKRRASSANHKACYVTGEGGTEENLTQISEICCTDAHMSRIPNKGCIPGKFFESNRSYSKLDLFQGGHIPMFLCTIQSVFQ